MLPQPLASYRVCTRLVIVMLVPGTGQVGDDRRSQELSVKGYNVLNHCGTNSPQQTTGVICNSMYCVAILLL